MYLFTSAAISIAPEGSSWNTIPGATGATYSPGVLTATTHYRRSVASCAETKTSGSVTVMVDPQTNAGTLTSGAAAFITASGTLSLSGYAGSIQKWQYREGAGTWMDITNTSSSQSYTNATTTYYRVLVKSGVCAAVNSNEIAIVIYPAPVIVASSTQIVIGPVLLDAGDGYATYTWRNSNNEVVATGRIFETAVPGQYTVTVTKDGVAGSATSTPVTITGQFEGQNLNYVVSSTILQEGVTDESVIASLPIEGITQVSMLKYKTQEA